MGAGIELGGMRNVFFFMNERVHNSYTVAFGAMGCIQAALICYWVFLGRGAEFLSEFPGLMRKPSPKPAAIQPFVAFLVVVGLVIRWVNGACATAPIR